MTASDNLRAERLRRTHEKFLEASEKYPTLCHLAIDAATAVWFLDERPRFLDESNQEDPGYDFSITLDLREGMLSKKFSDRHGFWGACFRRPPREAETSRLWSQLW